VLIDSTLASIAFVWLVQITAQEDQKLMRNTSEFFYKTLKLK